MHEGRSEGWIDAGLPAGTLAAMLAACGGSGREDGSESTVAAG